MLCANQYYRVSVGFVFVNRKQHKLIAKPHITNDYKSALTISIFLYFTMALVTFTLISLNYKPWLGALNDWNVPGSWLHAFCSWLVKSYLLIRSSSSPFFRVPAVGCGKYSTGFIKDRNELNPHWYNSLWSKEITVLCQFTHPDTVYKTDTVDSTDGYLYGFKHDITYLFQNLF